MSITINQQILVLALLALLGMSYWWWLVKVQAQQMRMLWTSQPQELATPLGLLFLPLSLLLLVGLLLPLLLLWPQWVMAQLHWLLLFLVVEVGYLCCSAAALHLAVVAEGEQNKASNNLASKVHALLAWLSAILKGLLAASWLVVGPNEASHPLWWQVIFLGLGAIILPLILLISRFLLDFTVPAAALGSDVANQPQDPAEQQGQQEAAVATNMASLKRLLWLLGAMVVSLLVALIVAPSTNQWPWQKPLQMVSAVAALVALNGALFLVLQQQASQHNASQRANQLQHWLWWWWGSVFAWWAFSLSGVLEKLYRYYTPEPFAQWAGGQVLILLVLISLPVLFFGLAANDGEGHNQSAP